MIRASSCSSRHWRITFCCFLRRLLLTLSIFVVTMSVGFRSAPAVRACAGRSWVHGVRPGAAPPCAYPGCEGNPACAGPILHGLGHLGIAISGQVNKYHLPSTSKKLMVWVLPACCWCGPVLCAAGACSQAGLPTLDWPRTRFPGVPFSGTVPQQRVHTKLFYRACHDRTLFLFGGFCA